MNIVVRDSQHHCLQSHTQRAGAGGVSASLFRKSILPSAETASTLASGNRRSTIQDHDRWDDTAHATARVGRFCNEVSSKDSSLAMSERKRRGSQDQPQKPQRQPSELYDSFSERIVLPESPATGLELPRTDSNNRRILNDSFDSYSELITLPLALTAGLDRRSAPQSSMLQPSTLGRPPMQPQSERRNNTGTRTTHCGLGEHMPDSTSSWSQKQHPRRHSSFCSVASHGSEVSMLSSVYHANEIDECLEISSSSGSILSSLNDSVSSSSGSSGRYEPRYRHKASSLSVSGSLRTRTTVSCSTSVTSLETDEELGDLIETTNRTSESIISRYGNIPRQVAPNASRFATTSQQPQSTSGTKVTPVGSKKLNDLRAKLNTLRSDCQRRIAESRASLNYFHDSRSSIATFDQHNVSASSLLSQQQQQQGTKTSEEILQLSNGESSITVTSIADKSKSNKSSDNSSHDRSPSTSDRKNNPLRPNQRKMADIVEEQDDNEVSQSQQLASIAPNTSIITGTSSNDTGDSKPLSEPSLTLQDVFGISFGSSSEESSSTSCSMDDDIDDDEVPMIESRKKLGTSDPNSSLASSTSSDENLGGNMITNQISLESSVSISTCDDDDEGDDEDPGESKKKKKKKKAKKERSERKSRGRRRREKRRSSSRGSSKARHRSRRKKSEKRNRSSTPHPTSRKSVSGNSTSSCHDDSNGSKNLENASSHTDPRSGSSSKMQETNIASNSSIAGDPPGIIQRRHRASSVGRLAKKLEEDAKQTNSDNDNKSLNPPSQSCAMKSPIEPTTTTTRTNSSRKLSGISTIGISSSGGKGVSAVHPSNNVNAPSSTVVGRMTKMFEHKKERSIRRSRRNLVTSEAATSLPSATAPASGCISTSTGMSHRPQSSRIGRMVKTFENKMIMNTEKYRHDIFFGDKTQNESLSNNQKTNRRPSLIKSNSKPCAIACSEDDDDEQKPMLHSWKQDGDDNYDSAANHHNSGSTSTTAEGGRSSGLQESEADAEPSPLPVQSRKPRRSSKRGTERGTILQRLSRYKNFRTHEVPSSPRPRPRLVRRFSLTKKTTAVMSTTKPPTESSLSYLAMGISGSEDDLGL